MAVEMREDDENTAVKVVLTDEERRQRAIGYLGSLPLPEEGQKLRYSDVSRTAKNLALSGHRSVSLQVNLHKLGLAVTSEDPKSRVDQALLDLVSQTNPVQRHTLIQGVEIASANANYAWKGDAASVTISGSTLGL